MGGGEGRREQQAVQNLLLRHAQQEKWTFDTHIGDELKEPCFGLTEPFLFIPMWRIFSEVYVECKKLLGVTDQPTPGEDA